MIAIHAKLLDIEGMEALAGRPNDVESWFKGRYVMKTYKQIRVSIVVSIPACHAGDPGSIPGLGVLFFVLRGTQSTRAKYIHVGHPPVASRELVL